MSEQSFIDDQREKATGEGVCRVCKAPVKLGDCCESDNHRTPGHVCLGELTGLAQIRYDDARIAQLEAERDGLKRIVQHYAKMDCVGIHTYDCITAYEYQSDYCWPCKARAALSEQEEKDEALTSYRKRWSGRPCGPLG